MLPHAYEMPAAILILLSGIVACFAGYRLFRLVLAIYGFILGAMLASSLMASSNTVGMIGAALLGGIVGALIMTFAYFVGIALIGAGMGALAAHVFWTTWRSVDPPALAVILLVGRRRGRRDAPAAVRHHLLHGVQRRMDDDCRGAGAVGRPHRRAGCGDRQRLDSLPVRANRRAPVGPVCLGRAWHRRCGRAAGDHGGEEEAVGLSEASAKFRAR